MKRILIISDGKPGHLNQSIAFCKIKKISYDILEVKFKSKAHKGLSFFYDKIGVYTDDLFESYRNYYYDFYDAVISAGSSTYYFNKYISKKANKKSIAIMYPKMYSLKDFDYIIAQEHDEVEAKENILVLPLNLSFIQNKNIIKQNKNEKSIGIIIGGNNKIFNMNTQEIENKISDIFKNYKQHLKYITTSSRTSAEIEKLLEKYKFDYKLIYSKEPNINPIGDFTANCEKIFVTMDSTSMISEIRANSNIDMEIIQLESKKDNTKYHRLVENINRIKNKIDFEKLLEKVKI